VGGNEWRLQNSGDAGKGAAKDEFQSLLLFIRRGEKRNYSCTAHSLPVINKKPH